MRFLLFLILIRFHYVRSDCQPNDFLVRGSSCNDDSECKSDPSGKYSFGDDVYYCSKGVGDRQCCLNRDKMCEKSDAGSRSHPLTKHSQTGHPDVVFCHENADCQKAQGKDSADNYHCFSSVCCSIKALVAKKVCHMDGTTPSRATCTISGNVCGANNYCDENGCCPDQFCEGGHLYPGEFVNTGDVMKFVSCTSNTQCEAKDFNNDTYCGTVTGGKGNRFCCPIPYSKLFRDLGYHLPPPKILKYDVTKTVGQLKTAVETVKGEWGKKCTKNSDCGPEEFCDLVVQRYPEFEKNIEKLPQYQPKMCFPAPRCTGKAYREPDLLGIHLCNGTSGSCPASTFCDTGSNVNTVVKAFKSIGVCCQYDCTKDLDASAKDRADASIKSYARFTSNNKQCVNEGNCQDLGSAAKCISVKDSGTPIEPMTLSPETYKMCCAYTAKNESELFRCHTGEPGKDTSGKVMKCNGDEDCNRVVGQDLTSKDKWDFECVVNPQGIKFCCPVAKCRDKFTYMRTENDCSGPYDCLKEEEDKETKADARTRCEDYYEKNKKKNKKCCPLGDLKLQLPYCTKRKCNKFDDCTITQYCHPTKKTCCYLGITKLDGKKQENSSVCQGACPDREIFGKKVAQYCVVQSASKSGGMCYVSPYVLVEDKKREVNKTYKTILIISIILFLVFAFLALIMFVNYRSKNFCDKYTPKRKKKGKKGKKGSKSSRSGTGGTTGDKSEVSGTGGTSGTKDVTGTSGTGGTGASTGGGTGASTGGGDGTSGTGA